MTTRRFLRMLGLSPEAETERARDARVLVREAISPEVEADQRAFERASRAAASSRWPVILGHVDADSPLRMSLEELVQISSHITAATGAGKTRLVGSLLAQVADAIVANAPVSLVVVDGKGDIASELLRGLARFLTTDEARSSFIRRLRVIRPFDDSWLPSLPLLAGRANADPMTIGQTVAHTLSDVFADASVGARQRAMLAALLALAAEQNIPFVMLPWLLSDLEQIEALVPRASSAALRLELVRLPREGRASVDGLSARLNALLQVPSLRACLSGPTPVDLTSMFDPGSINVIDLSGAPLGARDAARAIGSLLISALSDAAFDPVRTVQGATWIVIDELAAFLTSISAEQLERLVVLGRSFRTSVLLVHQSATQLPSELRSALDTNGAWRIIGRSAERDAQAAAEWFTRMAAPADRVTDAARSRWFTSMVGGLPSRGFVVSDRRAPYAPRRIESLTFDPPRWDHINATTRTFLRRGANGFPRVELEGRARELESRAEAAYERHRSAGPRRSDPSVPKRRRGAVP